MNSVQRPGSASRTALPRADLPPDELHRFGGCGGGAVSETPRAAIEPLGTEDGRRHPNVVRMEPMGDKVTGVAFAARTLKDAPGGARFIPKAPAGAKVLAKMRTRILVVVLVLIAMWAAGPLVSPLAAGQLQSLQSVVELDAGASVRDFDEVDAAARPFRHTLFYDFRADDPGPAPIKTVTWAAFNAEGLFIAVRNHESEPEKITAEHTGADIWQDDAIELYFAIGPGAPQQYDKFVVNAAGERFHEARARDRRQAGGAARWGLIDEDDRHATRGTGWRAETSVDDRGWRANIFIPWKALPADPPREGDLWRFALIRYSYTRGQRFVSSAHNAAFDNPDAFGYLHFGELAIDNAPALERVAEAMPRKSVVPVGEQYLYMRDGGPAVLDTQDAVIHARLDDVRARLEEANAKLQDHPDPALGQEADRIRHRLDELTDRVADAPALARRLATIDETARRIAHLDATERVVGPDHDPAKGVDVFKLQSPYLGRGEHTVEVLLPDDYDADRAYRAIYVLPVNTGIGGRWGDALEVVRDADLHNAHGVVFVTMSFDTEPWFGAHVTDPSIRHEDHLKRMVLPLVESRYAVRASPEGRLLLGFSKSGWGALSLLARDPDVFGYAASWDAPLLLDYRDLWGIADHYGEAEHMRRYQPLRVLQARDADDDTFRDSPRLAVLGSNLFGGWPQGEFADTPHTATAHARLNEHGIAHLYDNTLKAPHTWNAGWLKPAVEKLLAMADSTD